MRHNISIRMFGLLLFFSMPTAAEVLRFGATSGLGVAKVDTGVEQQSESPGAFSIYVGYSSDYRLFLGFEHVRSYSISPLSTGVSFSGAFVRWHFLNPIPTTWNREGREESFLIRRSLSPYFGAGAGFAQSSLFPQNEVTKDDLLNAVSVYLGGKAGLEYPVWNRLGLLAELNLIITIFGSGELTAVNVLAGMYYNF